MSVKRGDQHPNCKISDAKVREMRGQWEEWKAMGSWKGIGELAEAFGINYWTVRDIIRGKTRRSA